MLQARWFICPGERHLAPTRYPEKGTAPQLLSRASSGPMGGIPAGGTARPSRRRRRDSGCPGSSAPSVGSTPGLRPASRRISSIAPSFSLLLSQGPLLFQRPHPERFPRARPRPFGGGPRGRAPAPPRLSLSQPGAPRGRESCAGAAPLRGRSSDGSSGAGRGSRRPPGRGGPWAARSLCGQKERRGFPSSWQGLPRRRQTRAQAPGVLNMSVRLPLGHPGAGEELLGVPEVSAARSAWSDQSGCSAAAEYDL